MRQVVFVRLLFSVPVNFRFALAVKMFPTFSSISLLLNLGANPFISSKHFTRAFFILASTKLSSVSKSKIHHLLNYGGRKKEIPRISYIFLGWPNLVPSKFDIELLSLFT
jgi:hypothetical protein